MLINRMAVGDSFAGIAGRLAGPARCTGALRTRPWCSRGRCRPAACLSDHARAPAARESRDADSASLQGIPVLDGEQERIGLLQAQYGDQLDVIYTSNDGTFGTKALSRRRCSHAGDGRASKGRRIAEVITVGPR